MINVYVGEDTFESYIAASKKAKELALASGKEVKTLNADDISRIDEFTQEIEGIDMFSAGKIILAKRLFRNKSLSTFFSDNYERLNNYEIVIWHDDKVDKRLSIFKTINKNKSLFNFDPVKEWQISSWISKVAKAKGINLTKDQTDYISLRIGNNKWIILNELNKLKTYLDINGDTKLDFEAIEKVLGFNINGDIWKFLDSFAMEQKAKMLEEFEKLTTNETNMQYLISMLDRELNLIAKVLVAEKNNVDYKVLGMHPFVLQNTLKKAKNFTLTKVFELQKKLVQLDLAIKKGEVDEKVGMIMYLTE